MKNVAAIVLAGGQGTRLFPLTEARCKPAVSFGGRYRLIDIPISNSLNSKIKRIFVLAQYHTSSLEQHILHTYRNKERIEILAPENNTHLFKGTADAVRQNLKRILSSDADYFLILSGDQLYTINFAAMLKYAIEKNADLVIAALPVMEKEAKRMGLLKIDQKSEVVDFIEKPQDPRVLESFFYESEKGDYLGSMGIYIFKRDALINLMKEEGEDFGKHLIPKQLKKGKTFGYVYKGYWEDIGTIGSYYEANLALMSQKEHLEIYDDSNPIYTRPHNLPSPMIKNTRINNSLISQGSIIEADEIVQSIVGIRTHIKKGTIIRNSIILGNHNTYPEPIHFSIGENCIIQKAIVDEETMIGNCVRLINQANHKTYDGNGIYIRDGIIIVTSGAHLPDHFTL